ncbi:hypothetical protein DXG03_006439 [Asterophora parasitica]|uniref:Uncharacterized protein n=1 Tax=Asterophora parasitica TaxID=117018 RepID=A0A9P7FYQ0_9AGAR|nr:hypothetical protein DXG03_006439 [Asterophora parasitica]
MAGGGNRNDIYGSRMYGSGYPGIDGRGVAGRGFPFYFWPLAWGAAGAAVGGGTVAYLQSNEYGQPSNTSRPGGPMSAAAFQSSSTSSTFRVLADTDTVTSLLTSLKGNCSSSLDSSRTSTSVSPYGGYPQPQQVIQYYRASSIALTLDGYNNAAVSSPEGTPDTPLPAGVDTRLMDCLNQTIGLAAPLFSGSAASGPNIGVLGLVYVLWNILALLS